MYVEWYAVVLFGFEIEIVENGNEEVGKMTIRGWFSRNCKHTVRCCEQLISARGSSLAPL